MTSLSQSDAQLRYDSDATFHATFIYIYIYMPYIYFIYMPLLYTSIGWRQTAVGLALTPMSLISDSIILLCYSPLNFDILLYHR